MGWFDEQIKDRINADNEAFEESFLKAAGIIMGQKLSAAMYDQRRATTDAMGEILKFYHVKTREVPDSITEVDDTLEFLLRPHAIMRRNVSLEKGWSKDASGPMIGIRSDDGSVIALIPAGIGHYSFYDAKAGKRVKITPATESLVDNEAIVFYKPFPSEKMNVSGIIKFILENLRPVDIAVVALATLAVTLVGFITPKLNEILLSDIIVSGSMKALIAVAIFMVCVTLATHLLTSLKQMLITRLGYIEVTVEAATMMRVLSLPTSFFKQFGSGDLAMRTMQVRLLMDFLLDIVLTTVLSSLFSLAYISQLIVYAPSLVLPAVLTILVSFILTMISAYIKQRKSTLQMECASKESGMTFALITGIQKIKLAGAEKRAFVRWGETYFKSAKLLYDPSTFMKVSTMLSPAVALVGTIFIYFAAVKSGVSVSDYFAFNVAYSMVSAAFIELSTVALQLAQVKPILNLLEPILEAVPEVSEEKQVVERLMGGIELNNVYFRYKEDMPNILDGVSLKIKPGQYVAVVGKTGCGKSTLMRILLGFEKPQRGAVYYDGKDLEKIDLKSLRRKIGTVIQDGKLFTGDIYSNIVITNPRLTLDDAWEAAEMAGFADDIRSMPMGMFTLISEGQGGISGGQRQRLLIARAIAPKPRILMFDEATSALDNITQRIVSESLEQLKCTRIVIAHRLSTIKQCDRIIVLDKGHIIEDGSYDELIAKKGFFAELVERQQVDVKKEEEEEDE